MTKPLWFRIFVLGEDRERDEAQEGRESILQRGNGGGQDLVDLGPGGGCKHHRGGQD